MLEQSEDLHGPSLQTSLQMGKDAETRNLKAFNHDCIWKLDYLQYLSGPASVFLYILYFNYILTFSH